MSAMKLGTLITIVWASLLLAAAIRIVNPEVDLGRAITGALLASAWFNRLAEDSKP